MRGNSPLCHKLVLGPIATWSNHGLVGAITAIGWILGFSAPRIKPGLKAVHKLRVVLPVHGGGSVQVNWSMIHRSPSLLRRAGESSDSLNAKPAQSLDCEAEYCVRVSHAVSGNPHLQQRTDSRYRVLLTSRSIFIFRRHFGQFKVSSWIASC